MKLPRIALVLLLLPMSPGANAAGLAIQNNTVWKDDRGREIMCQGGNLCQFGGTFYFYGWADYPGDNRNDTITCYSSRDLASWKFERHIYTRDMTNLTLIVPDRFAPGGHRFGPRQAGPADAAIRSRGNGAIWLHGAGLRPRSPRFAGGPSRNASLAAYPRRQRPRG